MKSHQPHVWRHDSGTPYLEYQQYQNTQWLLTPDFDHFTSTSFEFSTISHDWPYDEVIDFLDFFRSSAQISMPVSDHPPPCSTELSALSP